MATYTVEWSICVCDIDEDDELAFQEVESRDAIKMATDSLIEELGREEAKIESARFVECDSGNISHANAFYEIEVALTETGLKRARSLDIVVGENGMGGE